MDREFESRPLRQHPATMRRKKAPLTEREIDDIVVAQADDDGAWGRPVRAGKANPTKVPLPAPVAGQAAYFARLRREKCRTLKSQKTNG